MTFPDYVARNAIAKLTDQLRAANFTGQLDAYDALRREIIDVRRRCSALEAENKTLKDAGFSPFPEPKALPPDSTGHSKHDVLAHFAAQLDEHAKFGNALKAMCKGIQTWIIDSLDPFNRRVDNRLRYLEMVIEETVVASSPELQHKLARIRTIVGAADLSANEVRASGKAGKPASEKDASS